MAVSKGKQLRSRWRGWWPLLLVAVLALGVGSYFYFHNHAKNSSTASGSGTGVNLSPAPSADNNANNTRKGSSSPSGTLDNGGTSKPPTSPQSFSAQIVSANVNNGNLHIGTNVSGTTTGNCVLTATKSSQPTLQLGSSQVRQDVNAYDCGVFNIPTSKFPVGGNWQLLLTVTNNGAASTGSATVTI